MFVTLVAIYTLLLRSLAITQKHFLLLDGVLEGESASFSSGGYLFLFGPGPEILEHDLFRVNFEVNHLKPFPHLAFPHSEDLKISRK